MYGNFHKWNNESHVDQSMLLPLVHISSLPTSSSLDSLVTPPNWETPPQFDQFQLFITLILAHSTTEISLFLLLLCHRSITHLVPSFCNDVQVPLVITTITQPTLLFFIIQSQIAYASPYMVLWWSDHLPRQVKLHLRLDGWSWSPSHSWIGLICNWFLGNYEW